MVSSMRASAIIEQKNTLWQLATALCSNCWLQAVSQHIAILCPVSLGSPFLIMLKDWILGIPEHGKHNFFNWWLSSELLWWRRWVFPLHALAFAFRLVVVNPSLVLNKDTSQKVTSFLTIPFQMAVTDVQSTATTLFVGCFWTLLAQTLWNLKQNIETWIHSAHGHHRSTVWPISGNK